MTEKCQMCGQPIDDDLAPASQYVPWPEHVDRRICVANIRADERKKAAQEVRDMSDEFGAVVIEIAYRLIREEQP